MKRRTYIHTLGVAALALGLAACGSDAVTATPELTAAQERADIAATAAMSSAQDLALMFSGVDDALPSASVSTTPSGLLASRTLNPSWAVSASDNTCTYTEGRYVCEAIDLAPGLVLLSSYGFFSADAAQELFDVTTTDSINLAGHLTGLVGSVAAFANINRRLDVTVARSPEWDQQRLWHGVSSDTLSVQITNENVVRIYSLKMATTIAGVTMAMPRADNQYPLSGTMLRTVEGTRTREGNRSVSRTVSYTALVTFNGRSIVPLDIGTSRENLTGHFCVDLVTGNLADVSGCLEQ